MDAPSPHNTLTLIKTACCEHPWYIAFSVALLLLAAFAETLGLGALLPLLNNLTNTQATATNSLTQITNTLMAGLGLQPSILNLLIIIVISIWLKSLIVFSALFLVKHISNMITQDLRYRMIDGLVGVTWEKYSTLSIGKISNAIATEAHKAGNSFMLIGKALASFIQILVYLAVSFFIAWKISVAAIVIGITMALLLKRLIKISRNSGHKTTWHMNSLIATLNEALLGLKALRAMARENSFKQILYKDVSALKSAQKHFDLATLSLNGLFEPIAVVFMAIGIYLATHYTTTEITSLLVIAFLFSRTLSNINLLQSHYQNISHFESAYWSIQDTIQDLQKNKELIKGTKTPIFTRALDIQNISFQYKDSTQPALQNISATIKRHSITVIFGPSGVGKSTFMDILLGFLIPQNGKILLDGDDFQNYDLIQWRNRIGYVPQEAVLFNDTVRNNIILNDTSITDSMVEESLGLSQLKDIKPEIPTGERGSKLSGGQRQRLSLARALVRSPEILILDEPTSGLDKATEKEIFKTLQDLKKEMTIIIISHNPEVLTLADTVIELKYGQVSP